MASVHQAVPSSPIAVASTRSTSVTELKSAKAARGVRIWGEMERESCRQDEIQINQASRWFSTTKLLTTRREQRTGVKGCRTPVDHDLEVCLDGQTAHRVDQHNQLVDGHAPPILGHLPRERERKGEDRDKGSKYGEHRHPTPPCTHSNNNPII